jgi:hypothetical protein
VWVLSRFVAAALRQVSWLSRRPSRCNLVGDPKFSRSRSRDQQIARNGLIRPPSNLLLEVTKASGLTTTRTTTVLSNLELLDRDFQAFVPPASGTWIVRSPRTSI